MLVHETYKGKADGTFRAGQGVAQLDPVVMISAMASVTESVCFGVTGSTTYIHVDIAPFSFNVALVPKLIKNALSLTCLLEHGALWTI